jgi:HEAT repeat protein
MRRVLCVAVITFVFGASVSAQSPEERSWSILKAGLANEKEDQRGKAADALALLVKNDRARQMAEAALGDSSAEVRAEAATALGEINLKASVPALKNAIQDKDTAVVFSAAASLYKMGDPIGYNVYYAVLTGERKSGDKLLEGQLKMLKDPEALAKIGFEVGIGFIPFGGMGLKAIKSLRQDNATPLRAAAAQRIARDPDPKSAQALVAATSDEKWLVRASALSAIAQREDPNLMQAAISKLDDPEDSVRFNAAAAVIRLSSKK